LAAVVASALLAAMASYVFSLDPSLQAYVGWEQLAVVFAALLVIGILICLLAAWSATQRYLTRSYDELFN
jgi:cell division protein FtsX